MKPLTAADIATMRHMRSKGQGAALIGQVFGARTMNELLDHVLALVPAEGAQARPDGLLLALLPVEAEVAEIATGRHVVKTDRLDPPPGRAHGVLARMIRELRAAGRTPRQVADMLGCQPLAVAKLERKDRKRKERTNKTAPPGAPAAISPLNAGTAAATCEATGQPRQGSDEVRPLREAGKVSASTAPAKVCRQSDRPTPISLPAPPPPPVAPPRVAAVGSAVDLAAMAEAALRTGAVKVTRCPTACAVETVGVKVSAEDADFHRRRFAEINGDAFAIASARARSRAAARRSPSNRSTL